MFKIVLSEYDNYENAAKKLIDASKESHINSEILYVEDEREPFTSEDIIYFLYNGNKINEIVKEAKRAKANIINEDFFMSNYLKDECQRLLKENGVKVPKQYNREEIKRENFPIYFKCKIHGGLNFDIERKSLWDKIKNDNTFNKNEYYLEKTVNGKDGLKKESKLFYVTGEVFSQDYCDTVPEMLKKKARKISDILKLECFSFDIIETGNSIYVIDVNPASGFFTSKEARKCFLRFIRKKVVEKVTKVKG